MRPASQLRLRGPNGPDNCPLRIAAPLLVLVVWLTACSDDKSPPSLAAGSARDAGPGADIDAGPPFVRPDDPAWPLTEGLVVLPYGGPPMSYRFSLDADLGSLDVHMSVDTTSSMAGEISNLQAQLNGVVIPALREKVPDVAYGVSRFEDFPSPPFGAEADSPFSLLTPITTNRTRLARAIGALDNPLGSGGDWRESGAEALWQIATGEGYKHGGDRIIKVFSPGETGAIGTIGGVGFRDRSLRVVLNVTDAPMQDPEFYGSVFPGTHGLEEAAAALNAIDAHVISILSSTDESFIRQPLEWLAIETGAHIPANGELCPTGIDGEGHEPYLDLCPLVFEVHNNGVGLSEALVGAIVSLLENLTFDEVGAVPSADPLGFVLAVRAIADARDGETPTLVDRWPENALDGIDDTFLQPPRGTPIDFEVLLDNRVIRPGPVEQRFRVLIQVMGDGLLLFEHGIAVVVPAATEGENADVDAGR